MKYFSLAWTVGTLILLAYVVWTIYSQYSKEVGTSVWSRLIAACRDSATILVAKLTAILAVVVAQLDNLADLFNAPEAKDFINQWVGNPKVISAIMLAITFLVFRARMRTLTPPSPGT